MLRLKIFVFAVVVTCAQWTAWTPDADAGLLRDWINRCRARRASTGCCAQTDGCAPQVVNAGNFAGLQPGQCQTTCQQTCSRVVVNYVPCTSYRTTYERVPVTQYRPQTNTDPCTGCTVTCMRPCTSYTYQTRQVPYTTYRPVYQTQTYQVPVTTITNDCNSCATGSPCATGTCGTGYLPSYAGTGVSVPGGVITTDGTFSTQPNALPGTTITPLPTPADGVPTINPQDSNRSIIEGSSTRIQAPTHNPDDWSLTATRKPGNRDWSTVPAAETNLSATASLVDRSPVTRKWTYSPVKLASYTSVGDAEETSDAKMTTIRGHFNSDPKLQTVEPAPERLENQGWETVSW